MTQGNEPSARVLAIVHQADAGPGVFAEAMRRAGVELDEWLIPSGAEPPHQPRDYAAVMALGGAMHADQEHEHRWLERERELLSELVQARVPVLGVCLGAQLLAQAVGGSAVRTAEPEVGWYQVHVTEEGAGDPVVGPLAPGFEAIGWHSYEVELPRDVSLLAHSERCIQAFRVGDCAWGIQFHSEVTNHDLLAWIEDSRSDPDADGIDLETLRQRSERSIGEWNELGRQMAERFLVEATSVPR